MALTCLDIITDAMQELGVLGVGKEPKAAEAATGLRRLQAIVDGLFGNGVGATLTDQTISGDTDLVADTRALIFASSAITLSFPEMPFNGARIQIKDMYGNFATYPVTIAAIPSDITLTGDATYVYIADTTTWTLASPLSLTSSLALGDDEFFTLELAKRLAPVFGVPFPQTSEPALMRAANRIRARFASQVVIPCDDAVRFLSDQSYNTGFTQ